jgi:hypothetical protein
MAVTNKFNRGLQANLPLFGVDGNWYFCEDTGALFSSVGTTLVQVSANLAAYATQAQVAAAIAVETSRAEAAESAAITIAENFASTAVGVEAARAETAEALLQPLSAKGQPNGYAPLNGAGQIPSSALPAIAISETYVVSSQAAMLALAADVGDIAVRTDLSESFILQSEPASTLANWVQLLFPPANVLSVFGRTGAIGAQSGDYSAFYDALGAATTAQSTAEAFATSAVSTETSRAETAEAAAISTAETFATAAVATEVTNRNAAITTAVGTETTRAEAAEALLVPKTTTVNGNALSGNIAISATQITTGTLPHAQLPALVSGDIPNNAANTTGTAAGLTGTPSISITNLTVTGTTSFAAGSIAYAALSGTPSIPTSFAWNVEGNATGNLTLANAGYTSTFNQTSAVAWLWANTTAGTASTVNASPLLELAANYYTGSASAQDTWTIGSSLAAGTNGASTLTIAHTGSTGTAAVSLGTTGVLSLGTLVVGATTTPSTISTSGNHLYFTGSSGWYFNTGTTSGNFNIVAAAGHPINFSADSSLIGIGAGSGTINTGITATAAGVIAIGNGTAGDYTGSLQLGAISQVNGTVATSSTSNASPLRSLSANYWTGSASATDTWTVQSSLTAGTNGASTLTFAHSGTSGGLLVAFAGGATLAVGSTSVGLACTGGIYAGFYACSNGTNYKIGLVPSVPALRLASDTPITISSTVDETGTVDTRISRAAAGVVAIGTTGAVGDVTGAISLTKVLMVASSAAPTSAGTAGTFGQIIVFGALLYFCSVTGAAGSATWNKLSMTAV